MRLSAYVLDSTQLFWSFLDMVMRRMSRICIVSVAIMSHENCGLDYGLMNQMEHSHVKNLANEIDVSDQSEEVLHQRKGNTKNRFS